MEFQEYPKCLYQNADTYRVVADADAEEAARAEGFMDHAELPADAPQDEGQGEDQADEAQEGGAPADAAPVKRTRGPNKAV